MKERTLLQIALVTSIVGIVVLFCISQTIELDETAINKLDGSVDSTVVVTGSVVSISTVNSTTFLKLQKDEVTTIVLFGRTPYLAVGDYIQVRGKVSEKDGEVGLIGEEVRVI